MVDHNNGRSKRREHSMACLEERMQLRMLQDDICEGARTSALQGVEVFVASELCVHAARDVIADIPQSWMPGRSGKHPLEHL